MSNPTPEQPIDPRNHEADKQRKREEAFILDLRKEATELKDCFTKYSFHGMSIAAAAMVFILRFQHEYPLVGLAALLPIVLLLAVCSMGTHKYAGVNRILGYELHLERTRMLQPENGQYWKREWRLVGWEEAMRAWRIVSATLIEYLCIVPPSSAWGRAMWRRFVWRRLPLGTVGRLIRYLFFLRWLLLPLLWRVHTDKVWSDVYVPKDDVITSDAPVTSKDICNYTCIEIPENYRWFEPPSLLNPVAAYHAGGYLKTINSAIFILIGIALAQLLATVFFVARALPDATDLRERALALLQNYDAWTAFVVSVVTTLCVIVRVRQINARRYSLEQGVLSIHSCAIIWQAALAAHFKALHKRESEHIESFDGYTNRLSAQAANYLAHIGHLNRLLDGNCPASCQSKQKDALDDATKDELYERAKALDIKGRSAMTKKQLVAAIRKSV